MIRNQRFPEYAPALFPFDRRFLLRILALSAVWFALTGSDTSSWIVGVPAIVIAAILSLKLASPFPYSLRLAGTLRFIPFFLCQSLRGAVDVMRRALSSRQLLNPGLVSYTTLLPEGTARIFFVNTISLLPGTLSAELYENRVIVHTLDQSLPIWANIQDLEYHVAALIHTPSPKKKNL